MVRLFVCVFLRLLVCLRVLVDSRRFGVVLGWVCFGVRTLSGEMVLMDASFPVLLFESVFVFFVLDGVFGVFFFLVVVFFFLGFFSTFSFSSSSASCAKPGALNKINPIINEVIFLS